MSSSGSWDDVKREHDNTGLRVQLTEMLQRHGHIVKLSMLCVR